MNSIGWFFDAVFLDHVNKPGHPESPARLVAIRQVVTSGTFPHILVPQATRVARDEEICLAHDAEYVAAVRRTCARSIADQALISLDEDTSITPGSQRSAWLNAGTHLAAIDLLVSGVFNRCFIAGRPPGHHARPAKGKGFCLFDNIAIAARYALSKGLRRVVIIDFDAHHGDGTQTFFWDSVEVVLISIQQSTLPGTTRTHWPHSGALTEDGTGDARGCTVNIPLRAGSADDAYLDAFVHIINPIVLGLNPKPELMLVSAGYDAHEKDPVCGQRVSTNGFAAIATCLHALAEVLGIPMLGTLEGGYDPPSLAASVGKTLAIWGTDPQDTVAHAAIIGPRSHLTVTADQAGLRADIDAVVEHQSKYHRGLRQRCS
jgi:acetoin utilization deacetylase AcuC-like enzyme